MIKKRLYEIDILRFLAAIMVVAFHYTINTKSYNHIYPIDNKFLTPIFLHGNSGVLLFFIISGFVILMSAQAESPMTFLRSRFVRLYPAFLPAIIFTFIIGRAFIPFYTAGIKDLIVNATLVGLFANWRLHIQLVAGVSWTLMIEMQFYLFIFILMQLRQLDNIRTFLVAWLVLSIATYYGEAHYPNISAFYFVRLLFVTEHSYYFIAGCYFYLIKYQQKKLDLLMPAICLVVKLLCYDVKAPGQIDTLTVVFNVLFFLVFYMISLRDFTFNKGKETIKALGAITYPLYLIHELLGVALFSALLPYVNAPLLFVMLITFAVLLAYLFNKFIETPITSKLRQWMLPEKSPVVSKPKKEVIA
ncbi:acyltransferase [Chitinophaga sp. HK235]|uniref:acyltransferase family protein n=1 Tax=Chitinophaga sp. HK235 TaxID=2952571 RepID=UPI001BAB2C9E|nr:acyltransferase [Chitinophaga sp. HK235]